MSAYYAVAYADRVELLTDGAIYTDDGTIIETREKVWRSDCLALALVGRGDSAAVSSMGLALQIASSVGTVDATIERFSAALERNSKPDATPMDAVIASVSETSGPQIHWFTTYSEFDGAEPFRLYNVGAEWGGGPQPDSKTLAAFGFPARMATSTLAESGADLFEALRQTKVTHLAHPNKPLLYAVGGHVDLTKVDTYGARTTRLRTWPDVVGQKIVPALHLQA